MTSAPAIDLREHVEAHKAAVTAELGQWAAYEYGQVPPAMPHIFALVSVERRFVPSTRITTQAGRSAWRVSVRTVGRTADECRWALHRATRALDEVVLTIGGHQSTRLQHESTTDAEPDDGRFSALSQFTYVL